MKRTAAPIFLLFLSSCNLRGIPDPPDQSKALQRRVDSLTTELAGRDRQIEDITTENFIARAGIYLLDQHEVVFGTHEPGEMANWILRSGSMSDIYRERDAGLCDSIAAAYIRRW